MKDGRFIRREVFEENLGRESEVVNQYLKTQSGSDLVLSPIVIPNENEHIKGTYLLTSPTKERHLFHELEHLTFPGSCMKPDKHAVDKMKPDFWNFTTRYTAYSYSREYRNEISSGNRPNDVIEYFESLEKDYNFDYHFDTELLRWKQEDVRLFILNTSSSSQPLPNPHNVCEVVLFMMVKGNPYHFRFPNCYSGTGIICMGGETPWAYNKENREDPDVLRCSAHTMGRFFETPMNNDLRHFDAERMMFRWTRSEDGTTYVPIERKISEKLEGWCMTTASNDLIIQFSKQLKEFAL